MENIPVKLLLHIWLFLYVKLFLYVITDNCRVKIIANRLLLFENEIYRKNKEHAGYQMVHTQCFCLEKHKRE